MRDRDRRIVEEFRANAGRVGGPLAGTPMLLLHHTGATSGIDHVTPLVANAGYLVVASNGGAAADPAWAHNLRAHPLAVIEVGTELLPVRAEELTGAARESVWSDMLARSPSLREYDAGTARRIPVFLLAPA